MEFDSKEQAVAAWAEVSPKYDGFNPQHKETYEAFTRYFARQDQGQTDLGHVDAHLEGAMASALADPAVTQAQDQNQNVDLSPEAARAEEQATNDLRQKWGAEYDQNYQIVSEQLNEIFNGDWDTYAKYVVSKGIHTDPVKKVEYSEFLLKMARK